MGLHVGQRPVHHDHRSRSESEPVSQGVSLLNGKAFAMKGNPDTVPTRPDGYRDSFQQGPRNDGALAGILGGRGYAGRS